MNPLIVDILKRDEGFRGVPYKCTAGKTTIGYGRNLEANPLTQAEAEVLLRNDIAKVEAEADKFPWYGSLDPVRQAVVLSAIFQLGPLAWREFAETIRYIDAGDYIGAARQMRNSLWAQQTPARVGRLAKMMEDGV